MPKSCSTTAYTKSPDGIILRSKSGNRDAVVLDGNKGGTPLSSENFTAEILQVSASGVTIADLSIRHAATHSIHAFGAADRSIENLTLHNLHLYDCGEQIVKVNSSGSGDALFWVDKGIVEGCLIEFVDNSVMSDMGDYYYTGGIDVHGGRDWIIRGNMFRNIWRDDKSMEHAVHFWSRPRGTLVENNVFVNCWRDVGFGMKTSPDGYVRTYDDHAGESPYFDHIGGMVRNNVIYNDAAHRLETGVELMNVTGTEVYHNTVISAAEPFNCMEYRWPNTTVIMKNNLCSHRIMARDGAQGETAANVENAVLSWFVDPEIADFHLKSGVSAAIDKGVALDSAKAGVDIDGQAHGSAPDIGADEYGVAMVVTDGRRGSAVVSGRQIDLPVFFTLSGKLVPVPVQSSRQRGTPGIIVHRNANGTIVRLFHGFYD